MSLIPEGIRQKLIGTVVEGGEIKQIIYLHQNKRRNYTSSEEKVQVETFLRLVLEFGYPVEHIDQFVQVTMGSDSKKEADIIVYENAKKEKPIIIVECKKETVSQLEFNQAVRQVFSYANALAGTVKYVWVTSKILNEAYRYDKERNTKQSLGSAIPAYGTDEVPPYKYVKGGGKHKYMDNGKEKTFIFSELKEVPESELTRIFKQAHDALWAGGQLNPSEAFDELDKLIFCKIWDEKYEVKDNKLNKRKNGQIYDFQIIQEKGKTEEDALKKTNANLAKRIKTIYKAGKEFDKEVFKDDIRLSDERIRTIVEYLQNINLNKTDLDSKGRAFETFMGSFFRGEFGQYFTPRVIVQFVVEALPITNHSLVLDTSCGSGGFLLHALDKVRRQADKEYPNHENDPDERVDWREYWHNFAQNNLYGIEINEQIARTAKMNMIIHDDGHTNVISLDGLLNEDDVEKHTKNTGFKFNRFDFIITNPPFGASVKANEKNYLKSFVLGNKQPDWLEYEKEDNYFTQFKSDKTERNNQSTEVLFLEQCYNYLASNGFLAIVIPDGILTNSSLQYVRDQLEDWFRIVAVVSMPQTAFTATGAGVKSSILFLRKLTTKQTTKNVNTKNKLRQTTLKENDYYATIARYLQEKKDSINDLVGYPHSYETKTDEKKTDRYKEWRTEVSAQCTEKINELKEQMQEIYKAKRKVYFELNPEEDYPIFMAIAENIGYDGSGKNSAKVISRQELVKGEIKTTIQELSHDLYNERITQKKDILGNELETKKEVLSAGILKELKDFINTISNGNN